MQEAYSEHLAMRNELKKGINVVLVAWAPGGGEAWSKIKNALNKAIDSFFSESADLRLAQPYAPFARIAREALGDSGEARVLYCKRRSSSVEETIEHAVAEGARHLVVVPLVLALDVPPSSDALPDEFAPNLKEIENRHPDVEILFTGPPFGSRHHVDRLLQKIGTHEPEAESRLRSVISRGFRGDWQLFARFMQKLQKAMPTDSLVAIRGSTVTGYNFITKRQFDAAGPGTSDLDMVLVGQEVIDRWADDGFYIPGVLTMPLDDEHPDVAPWLRPVREELQEMVGRPVHFQAMSQWFLDLRTALQNTPYILLDA